jgi:hypothetical protein
MRGRLWRYVTTNFKHSDGSETHGWTLEHHLTIQGRERLH